MEKFSNPAEAVESLGLYGPMIVADFGAGAGFFSIPVAKKISREGVLYALDIQEQPLEVLRKKAHDEHLYNIETIRADLERPRGSQLGNECADFVIIGHILFQASDKKAILKEAFRILKKTGRLMVVEWNKSSQALIGPRTEIRVPKEVVEQFLQEISLIKEKDFELGEHYYGIVARKNHE